MILTGIMAHRSVTRDMPQLTLRAQFDLSTLDVEKRTVDLVWTTGAPVLRGGIFSEPFWEELSLDPKHVRMARLQSGTAPLLNSHRSNDISDILGVVLGAQIGNGEGRATVQFDSGPEGSDAMRRVGEKTLRNVSVGYLTHRALELESKGKRIRTLRAVDWEPFEISLLPIGADAGAVTRSGGGTTPCEFLQERAMPDDTETEEKDCDCEGEEDCDCEEKASDEERSTKTTETRAAQPDEKQIERARVLGIQRVARALKRPEAEVAAAIDGGVSLDKYRAQAQDAYAEEETIVVDKRDSRIQVGEDSRDKWLRGAEAWIIQRAAVSGVVSEHAKRTGEKVNLDPGEFRGARMVDLARQSLERNGVRTAGMLPMQLIGEALTHRTASGPGAGTSDFPVLLENALHKVLLAAYSTTPDTWSRFCATGSVSDFRAHPRYRLGSFSQLSKVNEGGEFTNKSIPDATKESITASTKGNIIGITRQALINDDLGAFSRLATMLGRAARLSIETDVYALLALNAGMGPTMQDGNTLFHATHNNIGAGTALGVAGLDIDRVVLASQRDRSGNEILDLRPDVLVLPVGLGGEARVINESQYDTDILANKPHTKPNKVRGLFSDIVDTPRMTGTRRYLFASPSIAPTIEVAFLDGQQQPFMDMMNGWRIDGVEWKVRIDYAVGAIDYVGAVTNAGQ